ncbi:YEL023C [Zygosaccharomyces parabailii]|nr:YEL023C [Zygosaccharomyces parabailii]CDH16568.1 related to Protein involved in cell growth [Zygosaccharomyces bailii ISA1307]
MSSSEFQNLHQKSGKNIVLCFDGTCENFGPEPITNVLKLYQLLENQDDSVQLCYYQPGVGTEANFDPVVDIRRNFSVASITNKVDALFASSIDHHVVSGYLFLMNYYESGDKIYMFGFSRGAFVARALAGMLERIGLLTKGLDDMVSMAWKIYESWEYAEQPSQPNYNTTLAEEFKRTFSRPYEVRIFFQGLFDSVNSVGILRDRLFPCTQRSGIVDHVRHAVSLDERKGKFKQQPFSINPNSPKLFSLRYNSYIVETTPETLEETACDEDDNGALNTLVKLMLEKNHQKPGRKAVSRKGGVVDDVHLTQEINKQFQKLRNKKLTSTKNIKENVEGFFEYEPLDNSVNTTLSSVVTTDLIEKWFPGDHSDVGGGYAVDCDTREVLSGLSLRWMISEAVKHGVYFKKNSIHEFAVKQTSLGSLFSTIHDKLSFSQRRQPNWDTPPEEVDQNSAEMQSQLSAVESTLWLRAAWSNFKEMKRSETLTEQEVARERFNLECSSSSVWQTSLWWLLELVPIGLRVENTSGKWRSVYIPNLGRPRYVPDYGNIHWSVYWRIKYDRNYRPKNLPNYSRKLLGEFCGIKLYSSTNKSIETIVSPVKSYPTARNSYGRQVERHSTSTDSGEVNRMVIDDIAQVLYYETGVRFSEWVTDSWREIPDDLQPWLLKYPDL